MARRLYAVVNPAAGQPKPVLHTLNSVCGAAGVNWAVSVTRKSGDAIRFAQKALAEGFDVVAAFGGDGTVMEVASALMGGEVPVAILPGGTANVMSTELRIPNDLTQVSSNVIQPVVYGGAVKISATSVVIGVSLGLAVGGILAAFLVVPIMGTLRVLVNYLMSKLTGRDPYPDEEMPDPSGEGFYSEILYHRRGRSASQTGETQVAA
jgi:hypothetical protein